MCVSGFGMYPDVINISAGHGIFGAQLIVKGIFFCF